MKLNTQHITPIQFSIDDKEKIVSNTHHIEYELTPNRSRNKTNSHNWIIVHYTAAPSSERCFESMTNPKFKRSAHYLIPRDDETNVPDLYCLGSHSMVLWHAGHSKWNGHRSFNNKSIGIELQNFGKLTKKNGRYYTWFDKEVAASEVYKHEDDETYWHTYTPRQYDKCFELCKTLMIQYDISLVLGHSDVSGFRGKVDPGPAFDTKFFQEQLTRVARKN